MNYLKNNPVGVDIKIQKLQIKLYENLGFENIEGYGRIYIDNKKGENYPLHFINGIDYKEVLIDDNNNGKFFFVEDEVTDSEMTISKTKVDIIFLVNLANLYPDIPHRADEELKQQVYRLLKKTRFFFPSEIKITKGKDAIKDFKTKLIDMQPYHFMKFSGVVKYQLDN